MCNDKLVSVKMICNVMPEGQKLTGALVEYTCTVNAEAVGVSSFKVAEREIVAVYPVESAVSLKKVAHSRFIAIELASEGDNGMLIYFDVPGPTGKMLRRIPKLSVRQCTDVVCTDGSVIAAWANAVDGVGEIEPLADKFTQHVFRCERNGREVPYNLYLPDNYSENGNYPLLLFIHDRGGNSPEVKMTLRQGIGAVTWVSEEAQAKRRCIVLAPQFERVPCRDGEPDMLEATFDLVEYIMEKYAVDKTRVYTTGQSMGCMSSIEMGIRRPDFFTAFLLVAGQWDPEAMTALNHKKLFIIVSRGDPKAYPGMNASLALMEQGGAQVQRAEWDQDGGVVPKEQVAALRALPGNIHYAVLKTEKRDVSCHMDTWKVAYGIEGVKEWLFEQKM